jgi:hypothetical protein
MANGKPTIAFIGFGEAGQAIAAGLREAGVETIAAWDILFPQAAGETLKAAAQAAGVRCARSAADAVHGVDLIISAVTAASSVEAAQSVKAHLAGAPFDIVASTPYRSRIIVLTFREGCLCTPIQEGLICVVCEPISHVLRYWPALPRYRLRRAAAPR